MKSEKAFIVNFALLPEDTARLSWKVVPPSSILPSPGSTKAEPAFSGKAAVGRRVSETGTPQPPSRERAVGRG
jgi:hypothetical protein